MANRTLRRAINRTEIDAGVIADANDSDNSSERERVAGISDTDTFSNGYGNVIESNVDGTGSIDSVTIDPSELGDYIGAGGRGNDSGEPRKRRGRKPGSKNGTGRKKAQETIEPFILMAHNWASVLLKTPELALDQNEAKQLSDAYSTFCEYHDVPVMTPKRMSEVNLFAAVCLVYGPRIMAIRERKRASKNTRKPIIIDGNNPFEQPIQ